MSTNQYPVTPELDSYDFIKPSANFKKVTTQVIFSIILFFLFYVLLVALGAGLMFGAGWLGITIIAIKPSFITIAAGGGIIALGVMFFIFLIKFIFSRTKNENPQRVQIKESDHPNLFAFIRQLTLDTNTKFPKKIFVSPEVNAMVFYNSSFWSLFFPVRKNLEIGLGLVNSLTISEFKSVLAHEFGHFSQKSMKVGSYIYTVNQAIFNLVFEYDKWDELIARWATSGGIFGFFAGITMAMVQGVRNLLKLAYNLINVNYMKLSREMEYHADLVAVSVSGNEAFKNALRKIDFTSHCYQATMGHLNSLLNKKKISANIYNNHTEIINNTARLNDIKSENGNYIISDEILKSVTPVSRVNIKDQWASHPSQEDRESNISKVNIIAEQNNNSAWELFSNPEELQKASTVLLYQHSPDDAELESLKDGEFDQFVREEDERYKISEKYNGFYDNRFLSEIDIKETIDSPKIDLTFEKVFDVENIEMIKRYFQNKADLEILGQLSLRQIQTKYFEFDGNKYKRKEASKLVQEVKKEVDQAEKEIIQLDENAFSLFYQQANIAGQERQLVELYQDYYRRMNTQSKLAEIYNKLQESTSRLYSQAHWSEDDFNSMLNELSLTETQFKTFLKGNTDLIKSNLEDPKHSKVIDDYIDNHTVFCSRTEFDQESFGHFHELVNDCITSISISFAQHIKELTDFQLNLINEPVTDN